MNLKEKSRNLGWKQCRAQNIMEPVKSVYVFFAGLFELRRYFAILLVRLNVCNAIGEGSIGMALGAGALSLKRFQILSKNPSVSLEEALQQFKKARIDPLDLEDAREETWGFCHPFSGEPKGGRNFQIAMVEGENLLVGFRVDSKKIPGTLFRLQLKQALEGLAQAKGNLSADSTGDSESKGTGRGIQKKYRDAAKERIKEELLKRTLPNIKLLEIVWNLNSGEVWVTSTTDSLLQKFQSEFEQAFEVQLMEFTPGIAAVSLTEVLRGSAAGKLDMQKTNDLAPAVFARLANKGLSKAIPNEKLGNITDEIAPF
jgi:hypothetical protein